jgi:hypothetical protein
MSTLLELVAEAKAHHLAVQTLNTTIVNAKKKALAESILCGDCLLQCKVSPEREDITWEEFVDKYFVGVFKVRTANRYIQLFKSKEELKDLRSIREAYKQLNILRDNYSPGEDEDPSQYDANTDILKYNNTEFDDEDNPLNLDEKDYLPKPEEDKKAIPLAIPSTPTNQWPGFVPTANVITPDATTITTQKTTKPIQYAKKTNLELMLFLDSVDGEPIKTNIIRFQIQNNRLISDIPIDTHKVYTLLKPYVEWFNKQVDMPSIPIVATIPLTNTVKKQTLLNFIKKHTKVISKCRWLSNATDKTLKVSVAADTKNFLCDLTLHNWNAFGDYEIGIGDMEKFKREINCLGDTFSITPNFNNDKMVIGLSCNDGKNITTITTSSMDMIAESSKMKPLPDVNAEIIFDKDLTERFIKAKASLPDVSGFTVMMNKQGDIEIVVGYSNINSSQTTLTVRTTPGLDMVSEPIHFNANHLTDILKANSEFQESVLKVSDKGLAWIEYVNEEMTCKYYLSPLDDID